MLEVLDGILECMRTLAGLFHRNLGLGLILPDPGRESLLFWFWFEEFFVWNFCVRV